MKRFDFIIVLLLILICIWVWIWVFKLSEGFESESKNKISEPIHGIYNYFYAQVLNPYPYTMNKFFSSDTQKNPDPPNPCAPY